MIDIYYSRSVTTVTSLPTGATFMIQHVTANNLSQLNLSVAHKATAIRQIYSLSSRGHKRLALGSESPLMHRPSRQRLPAIMGVCHLAA